MSCQSAFRVNIFSPSLLHFCAQSRRVCWSATPVLSLQLRSNVFWLKITHVSEVENRSLRWRRHSVYAMVTMSSVMSPQARGGGDLFSSPTLASPAAQALNLTLTLKTLSPNPTLLTPAMVDPNPDWTLEELQQELEALSCNYRVNRFFKFLLLLPTPQLITQLQSSITNANPAAGFWHFSSWQGCECLCDGSLCLYVMFFLQDFSLDRDI